MGISLETQTEYMPDDLNNGYVATGITKDKNSGKKKIHLFKKIKKRFGLARRTSSCPGPNNLPPLQFHNVHGDNIRISRDGTMARRFESFCRAITFSARPIRINERICIKFTEISNNWNGGIRFGFTNNDPATLSDTLPKYACPDLTNRSGFWAKALHEQYCEKDTILYYYVNTAGDIIYGINYEEKGTILSGIDTRGLLWTIIDIYGNCTAIEFLDARIYMHHHGSIANHSLTSSIAIDDLNSLSSENMYQSSEQDIDRNILPSIQSLNMSSDQNILTNGINDLQPLMYNRNENLIPVPFHLVKGKNVRLSSDRFVASRIEFEFCQGYVFTARPIKIGEKNIVKIVKTDKIYDGSLAFGLTSCNPALLQPSDLPNDSDFLLDRPEYWVVSKVMGSIPKHGDEIAFLVTPNGEVTISKNNSPAAVIMHVDQSLQLWAFLDVYGSTQSVRMFRQQHSNVVLPVQTSISATSSSNCINIPVTPSINSINSQMSNMSKNLYPSTQGSIFNTSSSTPASTKSTCVASALSSTSNNTISMSSMNELIQIQPNSGGTVLVVNLPPTPAAIDLSTTSANHLRNKNITTVLSSSINQSNIAGGAEKINIASNKSSTNNILRTNTTLKQTVNDFQTNFENTGNTECTICYENQIDSVLYICGHMCMCYDCAIELWKGAGGGQCPLCRAVIRDVIRTYTT